MAQSEKLRVGIVGTGFGTTVHLPSFQAHERFTVVALASPTRAAAIAKERSIPHAFASCTQMLESIDLDVIAVTSPPFAHHADVLAALARGKHVLCEKPFALNAEQAEEMHAASQRAGTACALSFPFRYTPSLIATRELITNGHLGPLRQIELSLYTSELHASKEVAHSSWWFDRSKGGGVANAYMPHILDQALWLAGREPVHIVGFLRTANPQLRSANGTFASTVADGAFALLDLGEGLAASIAADMTHVTGSFLCAAHGEARTAVASGHHIQGSAMFTVDEEDTSELTLRPNPYAKLGMVHPTIPLFMSLLDDFVAAIDGKPNTMPTFADGLAVQRCLQAIGY